MMHDGQDTVFRHHLDPQHGKHSCFLRCSNSAKSPRELQTNDVSLVCLSGVTKNHDRFQISQPRPATLALSCPPAPLTLAGTVHTSVSPPNLINVPLPTCPFLAFSASPQETSNPCPPP